MHSSFNANLISHTYSQLWRYEGLDSLEVLTGGSQHNSMAGEVHSLDSERHVCQRALQPQRLQTALELHGESRVVKQEPSVLLFLCGVLQHPHPYLWATCPFGSEGGAGRALLHHQGRSPYTLVVTSGSDLEKRTNYPGRSVTGPCEPSGLKLNGLCADFLFATQS